MADAKPAAPAAAPAPAAPAKPAVAAPAAPAAAPAAAPVADPSTPKVRGAPHGRISARTLAEQEAGRKAMATIMGVPYVPSQG